MRVDKKEFKVFTFDELTPAAQQKALEKQAEFESEFMDMDFVYEDAGTIAALFGLDIRQTLKTRMDKSTYWKETIYYSGFCSQGDGACFEGRYEYKKGGAKAVKDYAPLDAELHRIVDDLQAAQAINFYRITASIKHRGHYYHSGCMDIDLENSVDSYREVQDEDCFTQSFKDFADWIYNRLEEEYDYRTSEEACKESIEANEYEYTIDGEIY